MTSKQEIINSIIDDVAVELTDLFDQNFTNKSFFGQDWAQVRYPARRGSLMLRTGGLRNSIYHERNSNSVTWSSSKPWAHIHNDGGEIVVTEAMKAHFWKKYYEASGRVKTNKRGKATAATLKFSVEAEFYKAMALKKVGSTIRIPQRRFIGSHPRVTKAITDIIADKINTLALKDIQILFKQN